MPSQLLQPLKKSFWIWPIGLSLATQALDVVITYRFIARETNPLLLIFWRSWISPFWLPLIWTAVYLGVAYYFYAQANNPRRAVQILFAVALGHLCGVLSWTPLNFISSATESFFILIFALVIGAVSDRLSQWYLLRYAA